MLEFIVAYSLTDFPQQKLTFAVIRKEKLKTVLFESKLPENLVYNNPSLFKKYITLNLKKYRQVGEEAVLAMYPAIPEIINAWKQNKTY